MRRAGAVVGQMHRRDVLAGLGLLGLVGCRSAVEAALPDGVAERLHPPLGRLIEIDGLDVHATDQGSGGPPVILIHGANVNLRDWTFSLSERLARRQRVIAMDRPGLGYSQRSEGVWTPARQAAQLRAAAREMGLERPIVVGHSWGGAVALAWALDAPDEVRGVISVSGANMPWGRFADLLVALGIGRAVVELYLGRIARQADQGAIEDFVIRAFSPQAVPGGYLAYVGAPLSLRASSIRANADDLVTLHDALGEQARRYDDLKVPVEIVHGEADWLLDVPQHVTGLAERLPDATISLAPGVGHMAHHARPDLLEAAIARLSARA